jgi:hypothetical protein
VDLAELLKKEHRIAEEKISLKRDIEAGEKKIEAKAKRVAAIKE